MRGIVISVILFLSLPQRAQFQAKLIEGDYAPAPLPKLVIEAKNKKYKDAPEAFFDKERKLWHAVWTQFDAYKSKQKTDVSVIYYSRSDDAKTWTAPKQLNTLSGDCLDGNLTVKGPMACVGLNGEIYVTWASPKGLAFQCSQDSGKTWLPSEKIINDIKGGWLQQVDGIKAEGLPFITCDRSNGPFKGRVYITWSDEKNGKENKDVFLIYSDDKGVTWTDRILVSYRPNHKQQFKPCMLVDTVQGHVYLLYFDKQNYPAGKETDLYLALSKNGGLKFDYFKLNETSFLYNANFTNLVEDMGIKARWVQVDGAKRFGLYETMINDSAINTYYQQEAAKEMTVARSFTFQDTIPVELDIKQNARLTAVITKPIEPGFEKVLITEKPVFAGKNKLLVDMKKAGLKKGNYVLTLYYNSRNTFVWITDE